MPELSRAVSPTGTEGAEKDLEGIVGHSLHRSPCPLIGMVGGVGGMGPMGFKYLHKR